MNALSHPVALSLIRNLSALRFYPSLPEGESRLAVALTENTLSVEHARAVVAAFEETCPTPKDIRETADNLRPKFAPPEPSKVEQWKAEGSTYDPDWAQNLITQAVAGNEDAHQRRAREWTAILAEVRKEKPEHRNLPTWKLRQHIRDEDVARIKQKLGFELNAWDLKHVERKGAA